MSRVADRERGRQRMHLRSRSDEGTLTQICYKVNKKDALSQRLLQQHTMGRKKSEYPPRL